MTTVPEVSKVDVQMDHESRLAYIEGRMESFATKEDLHKGLHDMTWKIIGAIAALVAAVYFIARYVS